MAVRRKERRGSDEVRRREFDESKAEAERRRTEGELERNW